jgi:hypothetical protein
MIHSDYLTGVFIPQIAQFDKMFSETVFPPFADPEAQANKVAQDYWDKKMSEPVGEFGPDEDPGDIADDAHQKSIDFYETMTAMHHTVVNLFTAGVFHLFEQQVGTLLQDWSGKRPKFPFDELGKSSFKGQAGQHDRLQLGAHLGEARRAAAGRERRQARRGRPGEQAARRQRRALQASVGARHGPGEVVRRSHARRAADLW